MKPSASLPFATLAAQLATASNCNSLQTRCCNRLAAEPTLKDKVLFPGQGRYADRLGSYYSANAALAPWCMVLPTGTDDVSKIATIFHDEKCPFGMRSGAHSAFAGSNSVSDGITVDFTHLNATTYSNGDEIARVQPGSDWGRVYETLDSYGVTAVGGRAHVVGVGGFLSGGGYSFHSAKYGFGCDTVRNFEIVLANGTVINANKDENKELWKAQKGGSGNFGFITRVDLEIVDTNQLWAGLIYYDTAEVETSWKAYLDFVDNMENQERETQALVAIIANQNSTTHSALVSNSRGVTEPASLKRLLDLPNLDSTVQLDTVAKVVPAFTGPTPLGLYSNWLVELYASNIHVIRYIDDALAKYTAKCRAAVPSSEFQILIELQPVTHSMVSHSTENEHSGNVLGLERTVADGPAVMFLIALTVDTAENQDVILPIVHEFKKDVNEHMSSNGWNRNWAYAPYAWKDQKPLSHYGEENVHFMREVSKRYDPEGVFQKQRASGFKIPSA